MRGLFFKEAFVTLKFLTKLICFCCRIHLFAFVLWITLYLRIYLWPYNPWTLKILKQYREFRNTSQAIVSKRIQFVRINNINNTFINIQNSVKKISALNIYFLFNSFDTNKDSFRCSNNHIKKKNYQLNE